RAWLNKKSVGRRLFYRAKSGHRPFRVEGLSCATPRAVAYAMSLHRDAARVMIATGQLTHWLERSLGEIRMADAVSAIIGDDYDDDTMLSKIDDKILTRLCRILDPEGPVYSHGKAVMLDGFDYAVAEALLGGDAEAERALEFMLGHALPVDQLPAQWSNARRQEIKARFRGYQGFVRGLVAGSRAAICFAPSASPMPPASYRFCRAA
ncbi:MAG: hypothetical protein QF666_14080, partial [Alphaproteobacteria bacterium]|nr:hypothetical protein [Alphaproteobacteria bacterium]